MPSKYTLHFYPNDKELRVEDAKRVVVDKFPAWGGDPVHAANGEHGYETTNKGTFIVLSVGPITTSRWPNSNIPWGKKVQIRTSDKKVYDLDGLEIGNLQGETLNNLLRAYGDKPELRDAITRGETITVPYRFNDFGSRGIKTFTDKNANGKFDAKVDPINPHYIHSTPFEEWDRINKDEKIYQLQHSHGCIHMYPSDIDTLASKYITKMATTLTVH